MEKKIKGTFTFKAQLPTGRYRSFWTGSHDIKIKKKKVGSIVDEAPYKIRFMVIKNDINEDGNPNCEWKWITIKKESKTLEEAKDFLKNNFEVITTKYHLM